jgi:hypothetical protein
MQQRPVAAIWWCQKRNCTSRLLGAAWQSTAAHVTLTARLPFRPLEITPCVPVQAILGCGVLDSILVSLAHSSPAVQGAACATLQALASSGPQQASLIVQVGKQG